MTGNIANNTHVAPSRIVEFSTGYKSKTASRTVRPDYREQCLQTEIEDSCIRLIGHNWFNSVPDTTYNETEEYVQFYSRQNCSANSARSPILAHKYSMIDDGDKAVEVVFESWTLLWIR